jgi:hypothetical protein
MCRFNYTLYWLAIDVCFDIELFMKAHKLEGVFNANYMARKTFVQSIILYK